MTRRSNGEGSIRKRPDGLWESRIHVERPNGGRIRRSIYGKTEREVRKKLLDARHRQAGGLPAIEASETVGAFLDRWIENVARTRVRPTTLQSYQEVARLHIKPVLGKRPLAKLAPKHVSAVVRAKLDEGLSPRRVQMILVVLRMALKTAEREGAVARNVAKLVDTPRVPKHEVHPLTPKEARTFLDAIKDHRHEALFLVAVVLGLRQGELLGLRWEDVDLAAGRVRVRNSLHRIKVQEKPPKWDFRLAETKTERSRRTLALGGLATAALKAHRRRQSEERLKAGLGERREDGGGYVFADTDGGPLLARSVYGSFRRVVAEAKLPAQRFHDLRHLSASLLIAQGANIKDVQGHLGHSSIVLTGDTYGHLYEESQKAIAAKMDAILGPQPAKQPAAPGSAPEDSPDARAPADR